VNAATQTAKASTGTGTLDATRAGVTVTDGTTALTGQQDIFGNPYDSAAMAAAQTTATSWTVITWNGGRWTGGWGGSRWTGAGWDDSRWSTNTWNWPTADRRAP
jgi:serine protease AprX